MAYVPTTSTLRLYMESEFASTRAKMAALTDEQLAFCDQVYDLAMRNYSNGADFIIECYEPWVLVQDFKTLDDVRRMTGIVLEGALNAREGTDQDAELGTAQRFENEWQ